MFKIGNEEMGQLPFLAPFFKNVGKQKKEVDQDGSRLSFFRQRGVLAEALI